MGSYFTTHQVYRDMDILLSRRENMDTLRWNRIVKILGVPPRGSYKNVYHRFIQEGAILDIGYVIDECMRDKTITLQVIGRILNVYSRANLDVKIKWSCESQDGVMYDTWRQMLGEKLKMRGYKSFKIENCKLATDRFPYL
jgi:hypothetical protein